MHLTYVCDRWCTKPSFGERGTLSQGSRHFAEVIGPSYIPGELGYALLASGDWGLLSQGSPHFAMAIGPSYITGEL